MKDTTEIHNAIMHTVMRPYQREWLGTIMNNRFSYILGSRQIGKSFLISYAAILLSAGAAGKPSDVLIMSKDLRASQDVIRDVHHHLSVLEHLGLDLKHKTKGSDSRIALKNGCYISAMPGKSSKAIQGHTGTVIIDEFEASEADQEESLAQAMFVSSSDKSFKVIIITNAGEKGGFTDNLFNSDEQAWKDRRAKLNPSSTTIYDAYPNGLPDHIKELRRVVSKRYWDKFYLNLPSHGSDTLVSPSELDKCINKELDLSSKQTVIAIDPGFVSNPSGFIVAQVGGGKCKVIEAQHLFAWTMEDQIALIKEKMVQHKASKIIIDQGTQAWQMAKTLNAMYPTMTINRSTNNASRARDGATLQRLIREQKISIPNYEELKEDILSIALDDKKNIHIPERPTHDRGTGIKHKIHGDCADALLYVMDHVSDTWERTESRNNIRRININRGGIRW